MTTPQPAVALRAVELVRLSVPMVAPLRSAHDPGGSAGADGSSNRDVVLVRAVAEDGTEGWGECSTLSRPSYNPEYTAGAWALLRDVVVPGVLSGDPVPLVGNPMARASVEVALADLRARAAGRSLSQQLGGVRRSVASCAVLGMSDSVGETCEDVARAVDGGVRQVKLKIRPGWSVEPLGEVRSRWSGLPLAADANGSFPPALGDLLLRRELDALDELDLAYLEQPFPADELVATAGLAAGWRTPVALDESVTSPAALATALTMGAVRVVNLKPSRVGGLAAARRVAQVAVDAGAEVFVGGMLETGLGRAAALAVASLQECSLPTDLGPSDRYFPVDVTDPFELVGGELEVPTGPGLGVAPDPERLEAFAVERLLLSP